ncbi:MAG: hypothetical protein OXH52_16190 [Gammaproteobacteria bacterium]|nr:hypothetical protein [Gammaproteobacteria bacterium]
MAAREVAGGLEALSPATERGTEDGGQHDLYDQHPPRDRLDDVMRLVGATATGDGFQWVAELASQASCQSSVAVGCRAAPTPSARIRWLGHDRTPPPRPLVLELG